MFRGDLVDVLRAYKGQWWRFATLQILVLLGLSAAIGVCALLVAGNSTDLTAYITADLDQLESRMVGIASILIVAIALVSIPFLIAGTAATAQVTDAALAGRRPRLWRSLARGFSRFLPILGTLCLAFLLVLAFLVATPFISLGGVLGLAVTGVIALVRRRRPGVLPKWPGWRTWGFAAIPFAWFARVAARAMLMLPAAVLEPAGPLLAHRAAERAATGRRLPILAVSAIAFVAAIGLSAGFSLLGAALWGEVGASLLGGIVQLLALPIPIVAAVALYRRAAGPTGRVLERAASPAPSRTVRSASPAMTRIASVTVAALVATIAVTPVVGAASQASADPVNAGQNVSFVVTSAVDTVDAGVLGAQQASCRAAGPDCTIRAALDLASQDAADGALSATIGFVGSMTITLAAPLAFAPSAATAIGAGVLTIDGSGYDVVLDGGGAYQILSAASEHWNLAVSGVTFLDGYSNSFAGGLLAGVPQTQLQSVLFDGNAASMGAGAIFAQTLTVLDSTFLDNKATGYTGSTYGGAVRATGHISIVNSTFSGSSIGDQFSTLINNGSDVYADDSMTVVNSTFVNSKGGSLRTNAPSEIYNSLFTSDWAGGGFACSGSFTGGANLSREADSTCPGTSGVSVGPAVVRPLDSTGPVPVFPLQPSGNPALGAGVDCPPTDAIGAARPANGCDLGAVEFSGATVLALETIPNATVAGTVTVRATVTSDSAAIPLGSVTFTFDGVDHGPIALDDPDDSSDDVTVAEVQISGLDVGSTYVYSAAFAPSGPFEASSAGPLNYAVQPVQVAVDLLCANPAAPNPVMAPECVGEHWNITDTESIHLFARVVDDRPGSVVIALDPEGTTVVAGPVAVVDGEAAFVIPASAFGPGLHDTLHAIYESDDADHAGVSPIARSLVVLLTPTVSISGVGSSGVYGDSDAGAFTVTVTGAAGTPTGSVSVFGRLATLDASGRATLDFSDLPSSGGAFALSAEFQGDAVYGRATSNTVTYDTTPAGTTTQIVGAAPVAAQFGEAITVTVKVTATAPSGADPQGAVTLLVDGTETSGPIDFDPYAQDGDGETTFDLVIPADALGAGNHLLVAEFDGNGSFDDSSSPTGPAWALSIGRAPTTTALVVSPTPSVWGDQVTLTATVDATGVASIATGTVEFSAGAADLGTATLSACDAPNPDRCAVASLTVAASAVGIGTTTLTAEYQGTSDFAASSGAIEEYVISKATPTVVVNGAAGLAYGHSTTYTITVGTGLAEPADGTEIVVEAVPAEGAPVPLGTVVLSDGSGTLLVPTTGLLIPAAYEITASFAGDASFEAASGSAALTVSTAATDIGLDSISATTVVYGGTLDVVLTVENESSQVEPEGDVVVTWQGNEVGRVTLGPEHDTAVPGVRTVDVTAEFGTWIPAPGEFWLTAQFVPASGFAASQLATDAGEERQWVTVAPLQTEVGVDVNAVLGLPLEAVATVDIVGDDLGITPGGWITFLIIKSGAGSQEVGPVALVDGQATLADALGPNPDITVGLAGSWIVRATYMKDTDLRYVSVSPNNTAINQVDVVAGGAVVTADAPESVEYLVPASVHVEVAGAVTPTGLVRVQLNVFGNILASAEVPLVNGQADIQLDPAFLAIGSHEFVVQYVGDGTLNSATSDPFTIVVGKTGTSTTVTTSSRVLELYPGIVGATVQYSAHVTATVGTPSGYVNFSRGSTLIGQAPVDVHGNAAISVIADVAWSGDIVAEFVSLVGTVARSTGTLAHSWVKAPVTVALQGSGSGKIGTANEYSVHVQFDWTQFQFLSTSLRPPYGPSGMVTVSDGDGTSCDAYLSEVTTEVSEATCSIQFAHLGSHSLTASYGGNVIYGAGSSTALTTTVVKGTPDLELTTPNGERWAGLSTIPVDWSVDGPSDGTVTIKRGSVTVCTSVSLVGSCNVAIPAYNATVDGDRLTLEYSGSALWNSATTIRPGLIIACIPFQGSTANPAGSATVSVTPAPTCGGGTGYFTSDTVYVSATPNVAGYRISGFSGGSVSGSFPWSYPASAITKYANGSASMAISPMLQWFGTQQIPFGIQANIAAECVPVRFRVTGILDRSVARNMLIWDSSRCNDTVTVGVDNSVTAYFESGTQVRVFYQSGLVPAGMSFYGWEGLASGDPFADRATYTIGPDTRTITAVFGPICYANAPNVGQPSEGTITVSLPKPNCSDPRTGVTGWRSGTPGSATLVDAVGTTLQPVTRSYVSGNGRTVSYEDRGWLPERPVYFDGWHVGTSSWSEASTTVSTDESGVRRTARTINFLLGERPFEIGAAYGACTVLTTKVIGDASSGAPGTATINTPSNCPLGDGNGISRWYRTGTQVSVTTAASGQTLKFLGWGGLPSGARKFDTTVSFALNSDVTATASYGTNANCRPLTISTVPAGALTLDTSFSLGANACSAMYGPRFYDQGMDGNGILINASPATPAADGAETVFAWTSNPPGSPAGGEGGVSKIWSRTTQLNEVLYGTSAIIAYACEFVAVGANVSSPTGQPVSSAGALNVDRESQSRLGDFLITQPANCATGSDPRSGYGGYAWVVGTQLMPVVTADPLAYRFTGWSGDVTGTGETPDAPLNLVGAGRTAQGDNYHYRVSANFTAICYKLSLPSDADKLEVITAPNCPGMAASEKLYLGGTAVVIHASDRSNSLFRNWVSGVDAIDADTHWASVIMTSDKSVVPYYSSKSAGEYITQYGTLVGDSLAIASKKMIGVASAAVAAYAKVLISKASLVASGIGYVAQGLEYLGVEGSAIDGMKSASTAMNSMITMLFAPLDCITAWSAGGENTAFYAAQNLIGTAIVTALSAGAQQPQQAAPQSTLDKLKAQAAEAGKKAEPGIQAVTAIAAAKTVYDAAASGNIGWEGSAYDAWASQNSVSIFTTCMANRTGGAMASVMAVGG
ncbi:MAG: hypothetical protein JWP85_260 [Rhodoglobus sp.]|nr:hypothetical protein [Rhodoglobus sp.]